jgi:hypothetical protein
MKDYVAGLVRDRRDPLQGKNVAREYLQVRALEALQRAGAMIPLAFQGGTALRLLFGLPRFSEDLDLALERPTTGYDFRDYLRGIQRDLQAEGYQVEVKVNDQKAVQSAFVRFPGLLSEVGLSPHANEVLAIKLKVDTNPPAGAGLVTSLVRRYVTLRLQHHDRASLLAGKLHALLQRAYTKGRDLYDLMWYLADPAWPEPNLELLANTLAQTGWRAAWPTAETWRSVVFERLKRLDWKAAVSDVRPFLERPAELDLLTLENLGRLLGQVG